MIPVLSQAQSLRLDSLAKLLPFLKDSVRIDCLNKISLEYYINALSETYQNVQTDTAISYAKQAYQAAVKINYIKGQAEALQNLGEVARDRGMYATGEAYFRQSIPLFEKIHARDRYSWANLTLGWCLHKQSKFADSRQVYERAMPFYIESGNKERQSMLLRLMSYNYSQCGYNEKAFEQLSRAIRITFKISDARGVISSPQVMGVLYRDAGEIESALAYFRLSAKNAKTSNPVRYNNVMGDIAVLLNAPDSAIYYYRASHNSVVQATNDTVVINRDLQYKSLAIGNVYLMQHKYALAIDQLTHALPFFERGNDKNLTMLALQSLAKCYQGQQKLTTSFMYTKRLLSMAEETGARPFERDAFELYWQIYARQQKTDSAYKYNMQYTAIKDSIQSDKYRRNIALSEMRSKDEEQKAKISLLQKEQQLNREKLTLQQQTLKIQSLIRNVLIGGIAAIVLIAAIVFRFVMLRRRNEKERLQHELGMQQLESKNNVVEFQQRVTELELHALRAQMNPHFIFNCLSSINRFILTNKTDEASDYLTKFSRLIRMALHNSEKHLITLESELEALKLYLDLERLRFKNAFDYCVTFINTIDSNAIYIPPMLIQPFAENAIWHGLMHKPAVGCLEILLQTEDKTLTCIIMDNGVGRQRSGTLNRRSAEKNKSMGVQITAGRLSLLNRSGQDDATLNIEDLIDEEGRPCGTKVILKMPYRDLTEVVQAPVNQTT